MKNKKITIFENQTGFKLQGIRSRAMKITVEQMMVPDKNQMFN